jgi:acetyl-CoA C-acetyltransferase
METSAEKMGRLRAAFKKDGTVTAGNASGINDAAAALLVMSADKARDLGLQPLVRIKAHSTAGLDPAYMGWGQSWQYVKSSPSTISPWPILTTSN